MPTQRKRSVYPPVFDAYPPYKGGRTTEYNGYVWEFLPGHHLQNLWGWVPQHRLVAEDKLGRRLVPGEDVHHEDMCRTNNDPDNLRVMPRREHRSHHAKMMGEATKLPLTVEQVRNALRDHGGIKPAARVLRCNHNTLRNRFPELCQPYQRVSPTRIDNPRDLDAILAAAVDPQVTLRSTAKTLRIAASTIQGVCRRLGVTWVRKSRKGERRRTRRTTTNPAR